MQISPYQWNTQTSGVSAISNNQYNLRGSQYTSETTAVGEDELTISNQGKQMAMRMQRMRQMDPSDIEEQATQMKEAVAELDLENLDLESMSSEELQAKAEEIHQVLTDMRPEGMPERTIEVASMSDEALSGMISDFTDKVSNMESQLDEMENVAGGQMPGKGGRGGGGRMGGMGGGGRMNMMSAMGATEETEESEETELIDTLLEALASDEEDEESNGFLEAIYSYLETVETPELAL